MGNLSGTEILIIGLIALIVLGPDKLPDALRKLGAFMRDVKRMSSGFQNEIRDAMREPPPSGPSTPAKSADAATAGPALALDPGSPASESGDRPPAPDVAAPDPVRSDNAEGAG